MTDVQTAESGSLSIEGAVAALREPTEDQHDEPAPALEAEDAEPEIEAEDQEAETDPGEGEDPPEEEAEAVTEAVAPLEAPKYWSKDAKADFAKLPPELQAVVLSQEGPREEAAAKAKELAATERQAAAQEVAKVQQLSEKLSGFLPQALEMFKSKWADVDFAAWAAEDAEAAFKGKLEFDHEQETLRQLAEATAEAERQANHAFLKDEAVKLKEVAPDLVDPEKGAARRQEVATFLVGQGIPAEALNVISAAEMSIAYDAMRWRKAQANVAAKPKIQPAPARPAVQAASAPVVRSSQQRSVEQIAARLKKSGDINDAVRLLQAQRK